MCAVMAHKCKQCIDQWEAVSMVAGDRQPTYHKVSGTIHALSFVAHAVCCTCFLVCVVAQVTI